MQLLGLDKDFQPVGYLQYFNLQWTREYYDIGQFSVKVDPASYSPDMAYVYTPERPGSRHHPKGRDARDRKGAGRPDIGLFSGGSAQ